jgi:signal transduction histidine kinase
VPAADGGGHGLGAMQERVARAGGTCEAGPSPDGWTVRVAVPR